MFNTLWVLFALSLLPVSYYFGRHHGYNDGYDEASEDSEKEIIAHRQYEAVMAKEKSMLCERLRSCECDKWPKVEPKKSKRKAGRPKKK